MSEAKGPYCKRVGSSEIQFRGKLEKCVYELTSPYVIDKQVEMINRAYEDGVKEGRASRDGLRKALADLFAVVNGECPSLLHEDSGGASYLYLQIKEALEADGECVK